MIRFFFFLLVIALFVVLVIKIVRWRFHRDSRFSKEFERVVEAAIADGTLTEKERDVLHKRAQIEGFDPDEFDLIIDEKLNTRKTFFGRHPTTKFCLYVLSWIMGIGLTIFALVRLIILLTE